MIPNTIHFAFTSPREGGVPFTFVHYLAVASAARYARPDRIVVHTLHEHSGVWWDRMVALAEVRSTTVPEQLFRSRFEHPAHQADAVRLDVLRREGGIFLDLDIISLRPYAPLLGLPGGTVLGHEDDVALCPAVILAEPGAAFVGHWIEGYDPERSHWHGFRSRGRDEFWGELSTRYPKYLAQRYPQTVTLVPARYFYPVHWRRTECDRLFTAPEDGGLHASDLEGAYAVHLWQTGTWSRRLREMTPDSVAAGGTALDALLRPLLEGVD